jgi:hypothetical protein
METETETESGTLEVLNCGEGHLELKFKADDPVETARAARIVADMLRRGYALFVEGEGKKLTRVEQFDEKRGVYIIADGPDPTVISPEGAPEELSKQIEAAVGRKLSGKPRKEVPMHEAKAVAVGRSAGG